MSIQSYARINGVDPASVEDLVTYKPGSCRYGLSGFTTSATPMTAQTIPWSIKGFDDANAYNTSTNVWTCPYPGVYIFSMFLGYNIAGVQSNLSFQKNGQPWMTNGRGPFGTTGGYAEFPAIMIDRFVVGDVVTPQCAVNAASVVIRAGTESQFYVGYLHP